MSRALNSKQASLVEMYVNCKMPVIMVKYLTQPTVTPSKCIEFRAFINLSTRICQEGLSDLSVVFNDVPYSLIHSKFTRSNATASAQIPS